MPEKNDTIFGKIIRGEIPASKVYEDDEVLAFSDIAPQAPVHVLVIPKKRIAGMNDAADEDAKLLGKLLLVCKKIAQDKGIDKSGYRIVTNCGPHGCQSVEHLHFHLVGGTQLTGKLG
ncbi:MAG: histidine triad nucleotide-binding protein [Planctomycetes bacterium]|nr:histidine triad nucleotide-binding protein [Planctomycetota bacterium]